jgi:hypothetical protein
MCSQFIGRRSAHYIRANWYKIIIHTYFKEIPLALKITKNGNDKRVLSENFQGAAKIMYKR